MGGLVKRILFPALLVYSFSAAGSAGAQTLDLEMPPLALSVSNALSSQGFRNIAALDFTDLKGQRTELGRFLSERLTVEMVMVGKVSMLDRANLGIVLAEHRLTEEGLVDPANAKQLGMFAGVDAIIIGNITMVDGGLELIVKAIATESARIVAAGRVSFTKTSAIQQLLNRGLFGTGTTSLGSGLGIEVDHSPAEPFATEELGPLRVSVRSVTPVALTDASGRRVNGLRCSFDFLNVDTQRSLLLAMNAAPYPGDAAVSPGGAIGTVLRTTLVDDRGGAWVLATESVVGVGVVSAGGEGLTEVPNPSDIVSLLRSGRQRSGAFRRPPPRAGYNIVSDNRVAINGVRPTPLNRPAQPPPPPPFYFGNTTQVAPGERIVVTMQFLPTGGVTNAGQGPTFFGMSGEIVIGVVEENEKISYSLKNLSFDRVTIPGGDGR